MEKLKDEITDLEKENHSLQDKLKSTAHQLDVAKQRNDETTNELSQQLRTLKTEKALVDDKLQKQEGRISELIRDHEKVESRACTNKLWLAFTPTYINFQSQKYIFSCMKRH